MSGWSQNSRRNLEQLRLAGDVNAPMPQGAGRGGFAGNMAKDAKAEGKGFAQGPRAQGQARSAARVRDYFPETLLWQPSLITDENGVADMAMNFADSITTWRFSTSASSKAGALAAQSALRVFQDFFVDIDLPMTLTQNDEVALPRRGLQLPQNSANRQTGAATETWFDLPTATA